MRCRAPTERFGALAFFLGGVGPHEDIQQDLHREPVARTVEIGVYSTVGAS